ncbi:hypothetical protein [Candidatus Hakubella thermalkaliphila]|nr:hypothetical protein [Candidatus Hakubella thermalkaliphila]
MHRGAPRRMKIVLFSREVVENDDGSGKPLPSGPGGPESGH